MSTRLQRLAQGVSGASLMALAFLTPFLRQRRTSWGATRRELVDSLPGDELMDRPKWQYTQSIAVHAPPEQVWPWLVQIGQGRGGFYSYEMLENMVGCRIRNAESVIPGCQTLGPGDQIRLHPKVSMPVAVVHPGRAIVLNYDSRAAVAPAARQTAYFQSTWLFMVTPARDGASRLISRFRIDYGDSRKDRIFYGYFTEAIATTMQKQMLKGIKVRVESGPKPAAAPSDLALSY